MGYWWRRTYRHRRWIFFLEGIASGICGINVGRIRDRSCDYGHHFEQKRVITKFNENPLEGCSVFLS